MLSQRSNSSMQRRALRAAADAERVGGRNNIAHRRTEMRGRFLEDRSSKNRAGESRLRVGRGEGGWAGRWDWRPEQAPPSRRGVGPLWVERMMLFGFVALLPSCFAPRDTGGVTALRVTCRGWLPTSGH
jgi:hypothetical protein